MGLRTTRVEGGALVRAETDGIARIGMLRGWAAAQAGTQSMPGAIRQPRWLHPLQECPHELSGFRFVRSAIRAALWFV
jgi:hypothetical protein